MNCQGGGTTEAIKRIRLEKGIGQAELGRKIGVTGAAVLAWETPGKYPEAEKLPRIADALGVSIDALYGRDCPREA